MFVGERENGKHFSGKKQEDNRREMMRGIKYTLERAAETNHLMFPSER